MSRLSVTILTFNEEKRIAQCLEALRPIADEIIVVDSFSTDRTVEICRRYGCRITQRRFEGYGAMRQYATSLTTNNYVLSIDADEVVSPQLMQSIAELKQTGFTHRVYMLSRLNFFCDQAVKHCGWWPDRHIRLFDKRYANWNLRDISEGVIFRDSVSPEPVTGDLLHYPCRTAEQYHDTQQRHAEIRARVIATKSNVGPLTPWIKATLAFLQTYVGKAGFLDGIAGRQISMENARSTLTAYTLARRIQTKRESANTANNDENTPSVIA